MSVILWLDQRIHVGRLGGCLVGLDGCQIKFGMTVLLARQRSFASVILWLDQRIYVGGLGGGLVRLDGCQIKFGMTARFGMTLPFGMTGIRRELKNPSQLSLDL